MIRVEVIDYGNTCGAIRHAGTAITRRAKAAAGICITARAASPASANTPKRTATPSAMAAVYEW
jgi:hypothetical protein